MKLELIIEARKEFAEKIANIIGEPIEIEATNITGLSEETALELYAQTKGYLNVTDFYRESEYQWFEMKNHNLSFDVKPKNK